MNIAATIRAGTLGALLALGCTAPTQADDTRVPARDVAGLQDPAGLPRYAGSVLYLREDVDYDEVKLPASAPIYADAEKKTRLTAKQLLDAKGMRARMMYITPTGRSSLEVLRNYQSALGSKGYTTVYECSGDDCGPSIDAVGRSSGGYEYLLNFLFPAGQINWEDAAMPACATGSFMSEVRYALLKNDRSGEVIAIVTQKPGDSSVYCDEASWKQRVNISVIYVKPKTMEQNMVTLKSSEMSKAISETGRVALYGILFDTNRTELKPESLVTIAEIAKLLNAEPKRRLIVVGHTDTVGSFESNRDLSQRRAQAVVAVLISQYRIDAKRLLAFGASFSSPTASNDDETGRARNRRVELVSF
ncbi:MAG TPA: OmpA family protein [Solimonas sp.]|nr:OmpA family protein [Solimonas sp.]